jgi:hypothetical protein
MLQHDSAMNISSSTLKIFYKFFKFRPTLNNFNRAFFLGKVPGTAHEISIGSEQKRLLYLFWGGGGGEDT